MDVEYVVVFCNIDFDEIKIIDVVKLGFVVYFYFKGFIINFLESGNFVGIDLEVIIN